MCPNRPTRGCNACSAMRLKFLTMFDNFCCTLGIMQVTVVDAATAAVAVVVVAAVVAAMTATRLVLAVSRFFKPVAFAS